MISREVSKRTILKGEYFYNDLIKAGEFPTFKDVAKCCEELEPLARKVLSKSSTKLSKEDRFHLILFVSFSMVRRSAIRPFSLTKMTCSEFRKAEKVGDDTYLVRVSGWFIVFIIRINRF